MQGKGLVMTWYHRRLHRLGRQSAVLEALADAVRRRRLKAQSDTEAD